MSYDILIHSRPLDGIFSGCSSKLFRPLRDDRLKDEFIFCSEGHVLLRRTNDLINSDLLAKTEKCSECHSNSKLFMPCRDDRLA